MFFFYAKIVTPPEHISYVPSGERRNLNAGKKILLDIVRNFQYKEFMLLSWCPAVGDSPSQQRRAHEMKWYFEIRELVPRHFLAIFWRFAWHGVSCHHTDQWMMRNLAIVWSPLWCLWAKQAGQRTNIRGTRILALYRARTQRPSRLHCTLYGMFCWISPWFWWLVLKFLDFTSFW